MTSGQPRRVLLVEDDRKLAAVLQRGLEEEGFSVDHAADGEEGLARLRAKPDLCLLDVGLPKLDGFAVLTKARSEGVSIPILILTARDATEDRVKGLNLGADDYLVKPFAFEELLARIQAVLRRLAPRELKKPAEPISFRDLELDPASHRVKRGDKPVEVSATQFTLLETLLRHQGRVLTREEILKAVWGYDFDPGTNVVDVHVASLRHKIDRPGEPSLVSTVRGVGYGMLEKP